MQISYLPQPDARFTGLRLFCLIVDLYKNVRSFSLNYIYEGPSVLQFFSHTWPDHVLNWNEWVDMMWESLLISADCPAVEKVYTHALCHAWKHPPGNKMSSALQTTSAMFSSLMVGFNLHCDCDVTLILKCNAHLTHSIIFTQNNPQTSFYK